MCEAINQSQTQQSTAEGRTRKRKRYEQKPERSGRRDERREVMGRAKSIWEELRPKATGKEKSQKLVDQLLGTLKGRIIEFVFRHDGSRIIQWMLTEGSASQQKQVLDELVKSSQEKTFVGAQPFFVSLACDRYAKHLAAKLLRVPNKEHRSQIYDQYLKGNVSSLMRTASGADILDIAFQTVVTSAEKNLLILELLYSKERKLFDTVKVKIASKMESTDPSKPSQRGKFAESLDLIGDAFAKSVVESAGEVLNQLVDKDSMLRMSIVHCALKEYVNVLMNDMPASQTQEIAGLIAPSLVHLTHTKAGAHVAISCIKILDAKHRKKAVRSLKSHVRKVAEDEYGHRVLISMLEWIDDTKLVGNLIFTELLTTSKLAQELPGDDGDEPAAKKKKKASATADSAPTVGMNSVDVDHFLSLCTHKYARMLILHLLAWRETRYFNLDAYNHVWSQLDEEKFGKMSKKDPNIRRTELLDKAKDGIAAVLDLKMESLLCNHLSAPIVICSLKDPSLKDRVKDSVAKVLANSEMRLTILKNTCGRKTLSTLLKIGGPEFANTIVDACGENFAAELAQNNDCLMAAKHLLMATDRSQAAQAVLNSKSAILEAAGSESRAKALAEEILKRSEMLSEFDSIAQGELPT